MKLYEELTKIKPKYPRPNIELGNLLREIEEIQEKSLIQAAAADNANLIKIKSYMDGGAVYITRNNELLTQENIQE
ncbi:hypothetical protein CHS0354_024366, partial [Potamilus streckersoni]